MIAHGDGIGLLLDLEREREGRGGFGVEFVETLAQVAEADRELVVVHVVGGAALVSLSGVGGQGAVVCVDGGLRRIR